MVGSVAATHPAAHKHLSGCNFQWGAVLEPSPLLQPLGQATCSGTSPLASPTPASAQQD